MLSRSRCHLLAFLLFLLPALALAQNKEALVNVNDTLTLRSEPKLGARTIEKLLRFQPVEILEHKSGDNYDWARVRTVRADPSKSQTGWVIAKYLTPSGFASIHSDKLNVRRGPGTQYDVIMHYGRNFPVQILDVASNGWVKMRDVDGDMGWAHPNLVKLEPPYVMTDGPYQIFNIRTGPGTDNPIKFRAEKGYLLEVLEEKDGWLHVKDRDGVEGWISAKIVFGWRDIDYPKEKS